jgi:hypothetical protein
MSTNGSQALPPSRDEVIRLATYYAAISGYYDTSEAAQKNNLLTIVVMDMANIPGAAPLPTGATHQFHVRVDATAYMVTRYADGRYETIPHDQSDQQREERKLREAVLDAGLWYLTGEGAGYSVGAGPEARAAAIKELLEESHNEQEEEEREEADPVKHLVIRDELPDLTLSLAPGAEGGPAPLVLRQWSVEIGPYNSCEVALFGYNEDGTPELITMDQEPDDDYEEEDEEE